jgi:hypothetical protein
MHPVSGCPPPIEGICHDASVGWDEHVAREQGRYADGLARLPDDVDARQRQLVRVANAAVGAALARLMQGRDEDARTWFLRAAERYRESYADAPPASWGRCIGAVKMRVLAGDADGAAADARWTLDEGAAGAESPIGRYGAALALLVLGRDAEARVVAGTLVAEPPDAFPPPVAGALAALAAGEREPYAAALAEVLRSFETREAYLEDVPVADTVLVLEALARPRQLAARPSSELLPASANHSS